MEAARLTELDSEAARVAAARSRLYQLLGAAFAFPDEELHAAVGAGEFAAACREACAWLPHGLGAQVTDDLGDGGASYTEFQSEYIRLFDVGAAGPPCPLYGGIYIGDRMKVMEEATRFYNFFQLHLSPEVHELPDHLTTELEFLHYLTYREAEARQHGIDATPLLRAQRDFLGRHLCRWMPRLQGRLQKHDPLPFFAALVAFAGAFFEADQAYARAHCGDG